MASTPLTASLQENQAGAIRTAKTAIIKINQTNPQTFGLELPFSEITTAVIEYAGLTNVSQSQNVADLIIHISATGEPKGSRYMGQGYLYTGAELSGSIMFIMNGKTKLSIPYRGLIPPDSNLRRNFPAKFQQPENAPFVDAFRAPGSFVDKLTRTMADIFGSDFIRNALENDNNMIAEITMIIISESGDRQFTDLLIKKFNRPEFRGLIAETLGHIKAEKPVSLLIAALADTSKIVVRNTVIALGNIENSRAVLPLIDILENSESPVRLEAIKALVHIQDTTAVQPLIRAADDPDDIEVRLTAIRALSHFDQADAEQKVFWKIMEGKGEEQLTAIEAAGRIQHQFINQVLIKFLRNADSQLQQAARQSLIKIGQPALSAIFDSLKTVDSKQKIHLIYIIGEIGTDSEIDSVIPFLDDTNPQVRSESALALGKLNAQQAIPELVIMLRDADAVVRISAAAALGNIGSADAVEALISASEYQKEEIKKATAIALGKIGDERAINALRQMLTHEDRTVRKEAVIALGEIQSATAVYPLIECFADKDVNIRRATEDALIKIGEPAVKELIAALNNENTFVRSSALNTIIHIGTPAVPELIRILNRPDPVLRESAVSALTTIAAPTTLNPLLTAFRDNEVSVRRTLTALIHVFSDPRVIGKLIQALEDDDPIVRSNAATSLGTIADDSAVDPLIQALADSKPNVRTSSRDALIRIGHASVNPLIAELGNENPAIRQEAAYALGELQNSDAIAPLADRLSDPHPLIRSHAAEALGKLNARKMIPLLLPLLKDTSSDVRHKTALALGQLRSGDAIRPLIELLTNDYPVNNSAAEALRLITGQRFGKNQQRWRQWLETIESN